MTRGNKILLACKRHHGTIQQTQLPRATTLPQWKNTSHHPYTRCPAPEPKSRRFQPPHPIGVLQLICMSHTRCQLRCQLTFNASPPCLGSHCAGDELLIQPEVGLCASCRNLIKSDSCSNKSGHDHSCIARGKTPHWLKQYTQCDQMALAVGGRGQLCASHAAFVKPDMLG